MNALTPTSSLAKRPISPALSPALSELLDTEGSPDAAARAIAECPGVREEARSLLPALKAVAEHKAGDDGVKLVIGKRFSLFPQPERNDGEWAAWWADYYDTLSDVPLACLEAAMRAFVARPGSQFMPKPGELRDLAFRTPSRSLQRFQRAKRALQIADAPPSVSNPIGDLLPERQIADDPAEVRRLLAEYTAQIGARSVGGTPKSSTAGKADEGGLTPQMRALIARREATA